MTGKIPRREAMKIRYLKLAEEADLAGDKEKAEKMRKAASRC